MAVRVAVDAMGGDKAPSIVVEGVLKALENTPEGLIILLVGPESQIREELDRAGGAPDHRLHIIDAPEVIGMAESPASAVKNKQKSSIHLGIGAQKAGKADAFVSAGNTGAVMAASLFILGRIPGVARPTLPGFIPTTEGIHSIGVDIGTNVDCKPEHLVQFAQMGSIYVKRVLGRDNPSVAIVSIGEEPGKGNEQTKAAYALLEANEAINFKGNVEGRDILEYGADVLVFDGFIGNIILKFGESCLTTALAKLVKDEMNAQAFSPEQQQFVGSLLKSVSRRFNYEEYGGAPLLGVNGNVLIGHGSSSARAIEQLIITAMRVTEQKVAESIAEAFS